MTKLSTILTYAALGALSISNCYGLPSSTFKPNTGPYNIWLEPYFSASKQRNIGTSPGYRAGTTGFIIGGEDQLTEKFKVGIAAGYAYTKQESLINSQTHADINNYITTLYGTYKFAHSINLDWLISGGQNYYNAYRVVPQSPNTIASSEYTGAQYTIHGALSKRYYFTTMDLIPQINGNIIHARLPEYTETGAGTFGNTIPENINSQLTVGTGIQAEWPSQKNQHNAIYETHALAYYDVTSQMYNLAPNSLIGSPALTTTSITYKVSGRIGGSFKFYANKHISIKTEYDLQLKRRFYNNIFFLIFKYVF